MRQFVSFLRGIRGSNGCPGEGNEASSLPPHPCSRGEKILRGRGDAPRFAFSAPSFQSHSLLTMSSSHPEPPPPQPTNLQTSKLFLETQRTRPAKERGPQGCTYLAVFAPFYSPPGLVHLVHVGKIHPAGREARKSRDSRVHTGCRSPRDARNPLCSQRCPKL